MLERNGSVKDALSRVFNPLAGGQTTKEDKTICFKYASMAVVAREWCQRLR
jgi:hypothetical protein